MLLALALSANSCAQLVVHSLWNVGIGTETPNSPLCISGGQIESPQTYASLVGNMGYALWVINIEPL